MFFLLRIGALGCGKYHCPGLILKNLDGKVKKASLENLFRHFVGYKGCDLKGKTAYINFSTTANAVEASFACETFVLEGSTKTLDIFMNIPMNLLENMFKRQNQLEADLFKIVVRNLDHRVDDDILQDVFSDEGGVRWAMVDRTPNGASKGTAVVCFDQKEDGERALASLHFRRIGELNILLSVLEKEPSARSNIGPSSSGSRLLSDNSNLEDLDCSCKKNVVNILLQCGCAVCWRCCEFPHCSVCGEETTARARVW